MHADSAIKPSYKATLTVNIKAKEHLVEDFLQKVEFERLKKEQWERPGFYIRVNKEYVPTVRVQVEASRCKHCEQLLSEVRN